MADFLYPTMVELRVVAQTLLPRLQQARVVFDDGFFPIRSVDQHLLEWEQKDNYVGLQQARGLNGSPASIRPLGGRRFQVDPGVYGEFGLIDERELTTRRQWGNLGLPIDISDLILELQNRLLQRRLDRIEKIVWDLLINGTFSVAGPNGAILHVDSFTTQSFAAGVPWATSATATPLADMRAVQLKSRGYSVNFGSASKMYMNRSTFNTMLINSNSADLYGRRTSGFGTINGPQQLNELLSTDDLPSTVIYDDGYLDENGTFQLFIPNNKVVLVGARRDAEPVGEYRMTRNANNAGMAPGPYMKVVDDEDDVPRTVAVHDGHSGGPVLYFPSAIVVMSV